MMTIPKSSWALNGKKAIRAAPNGLLFTHRPIDQAAFFFFFSSSRISPAALGMLVPGPYTAATPAYRKS